MFAAIIKAFPGLQAGDNIKKFCKYMGYKISWSIRGILQKNEDPFQASGGQMIRPVIGGAAKPLRSPCLPPRSLERAIPLF